MSGTYRVKSGRIQTKAPWTNLILYARAVPGMRAISICSLHVSGAARIFHLEGFLFGLMQTLATGGAICKFKICLLLSSSAEII